MIFVFYCYEKLIHCKITDSLKLLDSKTSKINLYIFYYCAMHQKKLGYLQCIHFPCKAIINSQEMGKPKEPAPAWDFTAGFLSASLFLPIPAFKRQQLAV